MPETTSKILVSKVIKTKTVYIDRDKCYEIRNGMIHLFADNLTREQKGDEYCVELLGVIQSNIKVSARLTSIDNGLLNLINCGEYPTYTWENGRLVQMQAINVSAYEKKILFFMGIDPGDNTVRTFKLTFDGQGNHFVVTLE